MQSIPGYSGFRRERDKEPVCEKPGDGPNVRNSKFARAATSIMYPTPPPAATGLAHTTTGTALQSVRPEHYRVPDKRGVMADRAAKMPRPVRFIGKSIASSSFADYAGQLLNLQSHTEYEFKEKFDRIDVDGSGYIDRRELRAMLYEVYDDEPGDRELNLFLTYFDTNSDGRISWEEFREGLSKVSTHMKVQNRTGGRRHLKAPWEVKKAPRVIGPGEVKSSQQVDVGDDGEDPRGRELMEGVGMKGTTTDLFAGTSKTTRQLPGYGGYIPQAHRQVSDAEAQAAGSSLRNTYHAKTNLMLTVNPAPPGYTGHKSRAPEHMSLQRKMDPRRTTEKAATDKIVMDYWKARNAAATAANGGGQ